MHRSASRALSSVANHPNFRAMNMFRKLSIPLLAAVLLAGCGGGGSSGTVPTGNADFTILVTPSSSTVTVGGSRVFSAVARDANGNVVPGIGFAWHSSNTTIAVSKGGGVFQGVASGTVDITATATSVTNSGQTFTTVTSNIATLSVTPDAVGTAAEGAPIADGTVSLVDVHGQFAAGGSDTAGRFDIPVAGLTGPFLLKVEDADGRTLYGFAPAAGVVNIDPYTDLLVRDWYALHGADPAGAFTARTALPHGADLEALDRMLTQMLTVVLEGQGLDSAHFSFLHSPFAADHRGFDRILDATELDPRRGTLRIASAHGVVAGTLTLDRAATTVHWTLSTPLGDGSVTTAGSQSLSGSP